MIILIYMKYIDISSYIEIFVNLSCVSRFIVLALYKCTIVTTTIIIIIIIIITIIITIIIPYFFTGLFPLVPTARGRAFSNWKCRRTTRPGTRH